MYLGIISTGSWEIRHHLNDAVSGDLEHSVIGGELAEIPGIEYGLDARVVRAQAPDDIPGAVCGIIINEYQLIVILRQLFSRISVTALLIGPTFSASL